MEKDRMEQEGTRKKPINSAGLLVKGVEV